MSEKMTVLRYQMRFLTPAFLGDAEQSARWRTPPVKALLRQFWRMSYAADHGFNVDMERMRHEEGLLFGHAGLKGDINERGQEVAARRSLVRIRLADPSNPDDPAWTAGTQHGVSPLSDGLPTSYAWYGLVKRGSGMPDRSAIKPGQPKESERLLQIAAPTVYAEKLRHIMQWVGMFGALGARSRGSWGSLELNGEGMQALTPHALMHGAQGLDDCLSSDWPAALAQDARGLCCWESRQTWSSWDQALRTVAFARKEARTALKEIGTLDLRAALGFAATGRMPSPLRWKVVPRDGNLAIRVFAMPHALPAGNGKSISPPNLLRAWMTAISTLDGNANFQRFSGKEA